MASSDVVTINALATNPFDTLPIETTQHIAALIDYDSDLCNFRIISRSTHAAIDADKCSFWRRRFLAIFERPVADWKGAQGNVLFKNAYQRRRFVSKHGAEFAVGETAREKMCLDVLRDWIVDSFSEKEIDDETYESANMAHLQTFIFANTQLFEIFKPQKSKPGRSGTRRSPLSTVASKSSTLMQTIQVLCAPILLSPQLNPDTYCFPDSQAIVYGTAHQHPIFHGCHGLDVNMNFVLHNINFWKYHMLREAEGTLFYAFAALDDDERPRWWDSQLKQGMKKLGKHWKGSYAYVNREEIDAMRAGEGDNEQIQDIFAGEDEACKFQDMCLDLTGDDEDFPWPPAFEKHLHSLTLPANRAKTRAQRRAASPDAVAKFRPQSFHFSGDGQDVTEQFFASGWLNKLPLQEKTPGWQRMTMMKYFENDDGTIDTSGLWAYEGVVLPGGQIIVGRWWSPTEDADEDMYSGPFILWCVDGPKYADEDVVDEDGEWSTVPV